MRHLIFKAQEWASEIRTTKPAKKHVELLMLQVHKDNLAAHRLYDNFDFVAMSNFENNDHIVMSHKLAVLEEPT